ncbi:hypothetical protein GJ496_003999 [Pomphorhynchus laevis]|nr:hypothetical protein GJ496_003999 [Pomphorhynchus laevis]
MLYSIKGFCQSNKYVAKLVNFISNSKSASTRLLSRRSDNEIRWSTWQCSGPCHSENSTTYRWARDCTVHPCVGRFEFGGPCENCNEGIEKVGKVGKTFVYWMVLISTIVVVLVISILLHRVTFSRENLDSICKEKDFDKGNYVRKLDQLANSNWSKPDTSAKGVQVNLIEQSLPGIGDVVKMDMPIKEEYDKEDSNMLLASKIPTNAGDGPTITNETNMSKNTSTQIDNYEDYSKQDYQKMFNTGQRATVEPVNYVNTPNALVIDLTVYPYNNIYKCVREGYNMQHDEPSSLKRSSQVKTTSLQDNYNRRSIQLTNDKRISYANNNDDREGTMAMDSINLIDIEQLNYHYSTAPDPLRQHTRTYVKLNSSNANVYPVKLLNSKKEYN